MGKPKVLQFISPAGFYGAERWILALARNLDPEKVTCHLAVTQESERQNLEVADRFRSSGLSAFEVAMRGRFDPAGIWRLVSLIRREGIEIIHTHGYKSDILGLIAARLAGIKILATPHGFENAPDRKLQFFMGLGCRALKYVDGVAPLSEELQADILRFKVNPAKVTLIMNGVDLGEVEEERGRETPETRPDPFGKIIGYVGQIAFRKNVADLIRGFDLLFRKHKKIRLLLIGDGPQRRELEDLARSLPSAPKIEFLGYRHDRLRLMKEMDLFCMTSTLEGIPRCLMEAMAMEVPVAAYQIPGVDKLIVHGETGLMAPLGHVEELVACWEKILFDGKCGEEMARNGRKRVLEKFSAKRMAEEYAQLYERIIKKAHSSQQCSS